MKYHSSFDIFFQTFKNVNPILISQAVQNRMELAWPVDSSLATSDRQTKTMAGERCPDWSF
jgi:hypothetical protein